MLNGDDDIYEIEQAPEEKYWTARRIIFLIIVIITIIALLTYMFWPVLLGLRPAPEPPLLLPKTLESV